MNLGLEGQHGGAVELEALVGQRRAQGLAEAFGNSGVAGYRDFEPVTLQPG